MVNFVAQNPQILNTFLKKFQSSFTKPAFVSFSVYMAGLFLELKRTSIQSIAARTPQASYSNTQYFISEAKWSHEKINDHRIQTLQTNRTTKSSKKGIAAIDDTGSKKWGYKTEGAQIQYYSTEKQTTRCNIVVVSAYCDPVKRYPINFRPYLPKDDLFFEKNPCEDFKDKLQLAKELIADLCQKQIQFSDLVFDNWYFACTLVEFIEDNHLTYITEADVKRLVSYRGKWVRAGELVKFIPDDKYRSATATNSQGETKSFYTYSFITKIKGLKNKVKVVVSIGEWDKDDPKDVHIYVSNHLSYSPEQILQKYALRWGIEWIFRDLKENVAFDHYQVRSIKAITRHWHLAALAYTFLLWCKLNGYLSKNFATKPKTLGQQLELFRKLNSLSAAAWTLKNYAAYQSYLGVKKSLRRAA